jgi:hypothetical protein
MIEISTIANVSSIQSTTSTATSSSTATNIHSTASTATATAALVSLSVFFISKIYSESSAIHVVTVQVSHGAESSVRVLVLAKSISLWFSAIAIEYQSTQQTHSTQISAENQCVWCQSAKRKLAQFKIILKKPSHYQTHCKFMINLGGNINEPKRNHLADLRKNFDQLLFCGIVWNVSNYQTIKHKYLGHFLVQASHGEGQKNRLAERTEDTTSTAISHNNDSKQKLLARV